MKRKEEWHIPQIKRRGEEGLIIAYLSSKESLLSASLTEYTMTALEHNWYPFALRYGGVRNPRLKEVAMWCSHQLRAQADLIDATFGVPARQMPYFPYPSVPPVVRHCTEMAVKTCKMLSKGLIFRLKKNFLTLM